MTAITLHPEFAKQLERRGRLREQLVHLLEAEAELINHVGPYLEALYLEALGQLELALLQQQAENARLRRQIELLRARLNRGESLDRKTMEHITQQLEVELTAWRHRLRAQEQALKEAQAYRESPPLSRNELEAIKALYRKLVRQLHPDMTGGESPAFRKYWHEVQRAYRGCDLAYLEILAEVVGQEDLRPSPEDPDIDLRTEIEKLERLLANQAEKLARLRQQAPYCYEERLRDESWIAARQAGLREQIAVEEGQHARLSQALDGLLQQHVGETATLH